jgi:hypothetical protein
MFDHLDQPRRAESDGRLGPWVSGSTFLEKPDQREHYLDEHQDSPGAVRVAALVRFGLF